MPSETNAVATYVTPEQKAIWEQEADDLEMTLSEFIRTMVQAGRSDFPIPGSNPPPVPETGGDNYEDQILTALEEHGQLDWPELVDLLTEDVESTLEAAIDSLEEENRIRYRPRAGGYELRDDE